MRQILALLTVTSLLAPLSCAHGKGPGRVMADALLPPREEAALGKEMMVEVEKELTILTDPAINTYVRGVGNRVARSARKDMPRHIQLTFKVVDDDATVNAFAMPGGYIYVYTGLLKKASNEAELAAVLGHEISHVTRRHLAQRLTAMYGLSALSQVALGNNPGLLAEMVGNIAANGYLLKHSRDAERDADKHGIRYTVASGFSPMGYVSFFNKLAREPHPPAILASHPNPKERVKNARKAIKKYNSAVTKRSLGADAYRKQVASLK